ncbi:MAG: hypothetical protein JNL08_14680 [Planctomycetes bacterium]|nr:hypothetical protein [Planctomycetota bacterium]
MAQPRVRPGFVVPMAATPADFLARIDQALASPDGRVRGQVYAEGAILRLRDADQRVWSPALHLYCEGDAQQGHRLRGQFSPSSPVWTAFLAIYLVLAIALIASACYGGAQQILGEPPWAFVGVPIALALAGFTYGAAFLGQGLAAEDMYELRTFVDRILDGVAAA